MFETRSVNLTVKLPRDIALLAEELQETDPDFLSRVVLYGLTRRSIYRHLRERTPDEPPEPAHFPGRDELSEHELRILAENPGA